MINGVKRLSQKPQIYTTGAIFNTDIALLRFLHTVPHHENTTMTHNNSHDLFVSILGEEYRLLHDMQY